jgi:peptide/nickel transport system substrate-binding protein
VPNLATSWDIDESGTVYTFKLREGVKFHDGCPFNAQAVVVNFQRYYEESPYFKMGGYAGRFAVFKMRMGDNLTLDGIEALDEYTVRFALKKPFGAFLTLLASYNGSIVSPCALEKYRDKLFKNPVGTGPFQFKEWEKEDHITMVANRDYWGEGPYLDRVIFKVVPNISARLLEIKAGTGHFMTGILPEQLEAIEMDPNITITETPSASHAFLALNLTMEPFKDNVLLRKAVAHAIDREAIVNNILKGMAVVNNNHLPPNVPCYDRTVPVYDYNPEKAKHLLAAAGYPDGGVRFELSAFSFSRSYLPACVKIAQKIQHDLSKIGINAEIRVYEGGSYWELGNSLKFQASMRGRMSPPDPSFFLGESSLLAWSGTGWKLTPTGEALKVIASMAQATVDPVERCKLYQIIQRVQQLETPTVPLISAKYMWAHLKRVKGVEIPPDGLTRFQKVWMEK